MLRAIIAAFLVMPFAGTSAWAQGATVNLTGTWSFQYWTPKIALHQDGEGVRGVGGASDFWFRGRWQDGRLLLVVNQFDERRKGVCQPRGVVLVSGTTVNNLRAHWRRPNDRSLNGAWQRLSPSAGSAVAYPYATELRYCGTLVTYELAFATGAAALTGTDWPILEAVAQVLKEDASLQIEVAGHTDSTGAAGKNQELSEQRAAAVKQVLVETYGADAGRISTRGWGPEQPVEDNDTEEGRALNRRVEIVLVQ